MTRMENIIGWIRHRTPLRKSDGLWNVVRPVHDWYWRTFARQGIPRIFNGSDSMRISPRLRRMSDRYEPEVWKCLMREVKPGDVFVDVGAFFGFYSMAVGKRVGPQGRVYAFEPDPGNCYFLEEHIRLNHLEAVVTPETKAVSSQSGFASFVTGRGPESRLATGGPVKNNVEVVTLDDFIKVGKVDILKIDVEGFEQAVLAGAKNLLRDEKRRPRAIFIEMHPFAWGISGASSEGIIALLQEAGYGLFDLAQKPMNRITAYGEAIARPLV